MTVYVWLNTNLKPRVQHLPDPDRHGSIALCGQRVETAYSHHLRRTRLTMPIRRHRLTHIDYDTLPMCRRCQKASTP